MFSAPHQPPLPPSSTPLPDRVIQASSATCSSSPPPTAPAWTSLSSSAAPPPRRAPYTAWRSPPAASSSSEDSPWTVRSPRSTHARQLCWRFFGDASFIATLAKPTLSLFRWLYRRQLCLEESCVLPLGRGDRSGRDSHRAARRAARPRIRDCGLDRPRPRAGRSPVRGHQRAASRPAPRAPLAPLAPLRSEPLGEARRPAPARPAGPAGRPGRGKRGEEGDTQRGGRTATGNRGRRRLA
jgi:hypothetical protein